LENSADKNISNRVDRPVGIIQTFLEDIKIRGMNCKYILDVGANVTDWSKMAKAIFPEAVFFLIEPLVELQSYLDRFCVDSPGSKYFLSGAGSKEEFLQLTVSDYLPESNFVISPEEYDNPTFKRREIKVVTIDSLIEKNEIKIPDLVKLDIQGFELEALKGASKIFGVTEIIIVEVSLFKYHYKTPTFEEIIGFMGEKGYDVYDFAGFLRRPYDGALGQVDICFANKNGFLKSSNEW